MRRAMLCGGVLTIALGGFAACTNAGNALAPTGFLGGGSTDASAGGELNHQIAQLRAATARYHDFDRAVADGFERLSGCVELPGVGGMGFHYGNPARIDGTVDLVAPEVLLYAPDNGKMKLVAVEYIVPLPLSAVAPSLFGLSFHRNETLGLWALHAWIWKHNPAGMFEDWNPTVSCS